MHNHHLILSCRMLRKVRMLRYVDFLTKACRSNLPNLHHLLDSLPTNRAVMVLHLPRTLLTRT